VIAAELFDIAAVELVDLCHDASSLGSDIASPISMIYHVIFRESRFT
jgi:hypothetical protein